MATIKCIYVGHNDVLLSDFNGHRFCFLKNKPQEVDEAVYKHMIQSHNVDAYDLQIYEEPPKVEEKPVLQGPIEVVKEVVKKFVPHKKKGKK